jgi:hypothetical protein
MNSVAVFFHFLICVGYGTLGSMLMMIPTILIRYLKSILLARHFLSYHYGFVLFVAGVWFVWSDRGAP